MGLESTDTTGSRNVADYGRVRGIPAFLQTCGYYFLVVSFSLQLDVRHYGNVV